MEIQEFVKKTGIVPLTELTSLAATRGCFGDDVRTAFKTQIELRSTDAQKVLDAATAANRDTLLASEQRSYDGHVRERDAILGLQRAIEQRTEQRAFVPESQRPAPAAKKGGLFGLELRALAGSATPGSVISPDEWSANFIDRLAAESVMLKAGIRRITTSRDALHLPRIDSDPAAAFYAEGAPITSTDPGYTDVVATPRKLASLQTISNELIADSNPDVIALLEMQVARALAFDLACEGSGTPPAIRAQERRRSIAHRRTPTNLDVLRPRLPPSDQQRARHRHRDASREVGANSSLEAGHGEQQCPCSWRPCAAPGSGAVDLRRAGASLSGNRPRKARAQTSAYVFEAAQLIAAPDTTITPTA